MIRAIYADDSLHLLHGRSSVFAAWEHSPCRNYRLPSQAMAPIISWGERTEVDQLGDREE